ncbi:tol-pal system YbgF family protein [Candidatus Poribacteria bacterium]
MPKQTLYILVFIGILSLIFFGCKEDQAKNALAENARGWKYIDDGKYSEAITIGEQMVKEYPGTKFESYGYLIMWYGFEKQGQLDEAIDAVRKAYDAVDNTKDIPDEMKKESKVYALIRLANLLEQKGEANEARETLLRIQQDYPGTEHAREASEKLEALIQKQSVK